VLEHDNEMGERTIGAIAMQTTGNRHSRYCSFSLITGKILNKYRWTELPMSEVVAMRIHQLDEQSKSSINLPGDEFPDPGFLSESINAGLHQGLNCRHA